MKKNKPRLMKQCYELIEAYKTGLLGDITMPEDFHPNFTELQFESRLAYFTLPMALNYQRDSYKLWESALKTFEDSETMTAFDIKGSGKLDIKRLQTLLLKYKLALQPNKHIQTWRTLTRTFNNNYGGLHEFFVICNFDFLKVRDAIQVTNKKKFPYLSGPKIFNYWSYIIQKYGGIALENSEFIEIAPDTHITQASIKLGIISEIESQTMSKSEINNLWRELLSTSGINPIELHSPLWFWSRNKFKYSLKS